MNRIIPLLSMSLIASTILTSCSNPQLEADCRTYFIQQGKSAAVPIPAPVGKSRRDKLLSLLTNIVKYETYRLSSLKALPLVLPDSTKLQQSEANALDQIVQAWQKRLDFVASLNDRASDAQTEAQYKQFTDSNRQEFQEIFAKAWEASERWLEYCKNTNIIRE